jgi:hypothetical protein
VILAPRGLKDSHLRPGGPTETRLARDSPASICYDVELDTLVHDLRGIEIIRCDSPTLAVKPVAEDGKLLRDAHIWAEYKPLRERYEKQGRWVRTHAGFEKQSDGRQRCSLNLLPDEEFTPTVEAEGYEWKAERLKLTEGEVKELEVRLKKRSG